MKSAYSSKQVNEAYFRRLCQFIYLDSDSIARWSWLSNEFFAKYIFDFIDTSRYE